MDPIKSTRKYSWSFGTALQWAFLEWLLMFMLFIDASISYLVTKFARTSKLKIPCLICSRLDHFFGKECAGFYWELVCESHKLEIKEKLVNLHKTTCQNGADSACAPTVLHVHNKPISSDEQLSCSTSNSPEEANEVPIKSVAQIHQMIKNNNLDLGDAYKLAVGNNRRQLSGKFSHQLSMKESSSSLSEDLKILLSQRSFVRGISLERNESNISIDDTTSLTDIEGETILDRLNRQVEHDKQLISNLYKELDEERNASAIATNQAMAMITRLQEEKASLNIEALQCIREMEDQADFDAEALEKANETILENDTKIRSMQVQLDAYEKQYGELR